MKKNMGAADRAIRIVVAFGIGALYLTGTIGGAVAIVLGVVASVFLVTSLLGNCPAYLPFGISTRKGRHPSASA